MNKEIERFVAKILDPYQIRFYFKDENGKKVYALRCIVASSSSNNKQDLLFIGKNFQAIEKQITEYGSTTLKGGRGFSEEAKIKSSLSSIIPIDNEVEVVQYSDKYIKEHKFQLFPTFRKTNNILVSLSELIRDYSFELQKIVTAYNELLDNVKRERLLETSPNVMSKEDIGKLIQFIDSAKKYLEKIIFQQGFLHLTVQLLYESVDEITVDRLINNTYSKISVIDLLSKAPNVEKNIRQNINNAKNSIHAYRRFHSENDIDI